MSDTIYRQDAIDAIRNADFHFTIKSDINFADYCETVQEIFNNVLDAQQQALEQLPTAQPTQTNADSTQTNALDCVSRQAAIDAVAKWFYDVFGIKESDGTATIFKRLRELPSAQPEIIRCKDCKLNPKYEWFGCPMSHLSEKQRPETAWCWKAERRTDERR